MFEVRVSGIAPVPEFSCVKALMDYLSTLRNNHLSVIRKLENGVWRVFYVSVNDIGEIRETYSKQKLVTSEHLLS